MATYSVQPTNVQAVQFDGTLASVAPFLGGAATYTIGPNGSLLLETVYGRKAAQVNDWVVRTPTANSDMFDESTDSVISVIPAAVFAAQYTFVSNP